MKLFSGFLDQTWRGGNTDSITVSQQCAVLFQHFRRMSDCPSILVAYSVIIYQQDLLHPHSILLLFQFPDPFLQDAYLLDQ